MSERFEGSQKDTPASKLEPGSKILKALHPIALAIMTIVSSPDSTDARARPTEKLPEITNLDMTQRVGNPGDWEHVGGEINERSAYILTALYRLISLAGNPDTTTSPVLNESQQECLSRMTEVFSLLVHPNSLIHTETTLLTMDTQKEPEFNSYAKAEIVRLLGPYFPDPMTPEQQTSLIEVLKVFVKNNPLEGTGPESRLPTEDSAE